MSAKALRLHGEEKDERSKAWLHSTTWQNTFPLRAPCIRSPSQTAMKRLCRMAFKGDAIGDPWRIGHLKVKTGLWCFHFISFRSSFCLIQGWSLLGQLRLRSSRRKTSKAYVRRHESETNANSCVGKFCYCREFFVFSYQISFLNGSCTHIARAERSRCWGI